MSPRTPTSENDDEPIESPKPRRKRSTTKNPNKRATSSRLKAVDPGKTDQRRKTTQSRKVKADDGPSAGRVLLGGLYRLLQLILIGIIRAIQLAYRFGRWAVPPIWARAKLLSPFVWIGIIVVCVLLASGTYEFVISLPTPTPTPPVIAPFFSASVQYWKPQIQRWSIDYKIDANLIATVMQIESCGFPGAASTVGAQGLFQVMPFHFDSAETMTDPDTNARRGLGVLQDCLNRAGNDPGLALACYNGGPRLINLPSSAWPTETQQYYTWGVGIYTEARSGILNSPSLNSWLTAGGSYLCDQAALTLGLATTQPGFSALPSSTPIPVISTATPPPPTPFPTITPAVQLFLTPGQ